MDFGLKFLSKLVSSSFPLFASNRARNQARCLALKSNLILENTTILNVAYVLALNTYGPCTAKAHASVPLCRMQFSTHTSATSAMRIAAGIHYNVLEYGSSMHFATGIQTAPRYPEYFDDVLAGAPATDFNHLLLWMGMMARAIGAPNPAAAPEFIPPELSPMRAISGLRRFCSTVAATSSALRSLRLKRCARHNGGLLYSRSDPGSDSTHMGGATFSGDFPGITQDWLKYAVLNVTDFDFTQYGPAEGRLMDAIDPGGIATFHGDMSAFRDRGGKFPTYLPRAPRSGNSKSMHTSSPHPLHAFYCLFLVPGWWAAGLGGMNARIKSSHNVLLALVDWVEGGSGPESITGMAEDGAERVHSAKSTHRVHRNTAKRIRQSPRRSSNIFRTRRDSLDFSDDDEHDENHDPHAIHTSPAKKSRPSYSWDNETTLVSALLHDGQGEDPADPTVKLSALADSLQEPFTRAGTALLHDMAHTLQPAIQRVTTAHKTLARHVDPAFTTGLLSFDDACKSFEDLTIDEYRALKQAYAATETRIKGLFERLEEAYRDRDRLWVELEAILASNVDPALAALAEVPAATERTIAALEKHAKSLAVKDDGAEKLRGVLANLKFM
ncbi:hypothetical protein B0H12DRAFT_1228886 [Mycena haematopus]|nr:hypothetical protein B0H12DRAFT_1228886 [Mycena haematopus]